jgi:hypothetical protein
MALVRCEKKHGPPARGNYVMSVKPVGYPDTAAICGRKGCEYPGLVWLTGEEQAAYRKGQRIFAVPSAAVKIKAL